MKRNQFYLTVIRLLVKSIFFYVLGVSVALNAQKNELLVNVDESRVGEANKEIVLQKMNSGDEFKATSLNYDEKPIMYTLERAIVYLVMNTHRPTRIIYKTNVFRIRKHYALSVKPRKVRDFHDAAWKKRARGDDLLDDTG